MKKFGIFCVLFGLLAIGVLYSMESEARTTNISSKKPIVHAVVASEPCYKNPTIWVYMYHYTRPDNWNTPKSLVWNLSVTPDEFETHIKHLSDLRAHKKIAIVKLSTLIQLQKKGCYPNKNMVILTSDDAWYDNYVFLFPTIKKYHIPFHIAPIVHDIVPANGPTNEFMNESQIDAMLHSGYVELFSHTYYHLDQRHITEKVAKTEICDSRDVLQKKFGVPVNAFIYPAGKIGPYSEKYLKSCGYTYAFTILNKPDQVSDLQKKPFELTRMRVNRGMKLEKLFPF